jgi:hypothetical protein
MTNYEKAFKELYEAVQGTSDQALRLKALNMREDMLIQSEIQQQQEQPKEAGLTKADFEKMTYAERVQLKIRQPDVYKQLMGGK